MMLATKGTLADLSRPGFLIDTKYDGWRAVAKRSGNHVTLTSRQGNDISAYAPEVCEALLELPMDGFVLDCELVTYDPNGIAQLPLMQMPIGRSLVAFDALELTRCGECLDLRPAPLASRKRLLAMLVDTYSPLITCSAWVEQDGPAFFNDIVANAGEGVIAKDAAASYTSGRSCAWRKWKPHYA